LVTGIAAGQLVVAVLAKCLAAIGAGVEGVVA
jgi:hypothetical protein